MRKFLQVIFLLTVMSIVIIAVIESRSEDMSKRVPLMRADLQLIDGEIGYKAAGKLVVFSKPTGAYVELRYRPNDVAGFMERLKSVSQKIGYLNRDVRASSYKNGRSAFLCNRKYSNQFIDAGQVESGEVVVAIHARRPHLLGKAVCS